MFFGPGPMELAVIFLLFGTSVGVPVGVPPQPVDPMIEKAAPESCLVYFSWVESGEPKADSVNRLEKLLADVEIQQLSKVLWEQLDAGMEKFAARDKTEEAKALAALVPLAARELLEGPGAIYLADLQLKGAGIDVDAGLILGVGKEGPQVVKLIDQFCSALTRGPPTAVKIDGKTFHQFVLGEGMPPITWGLNGDYLLVGVGESAIGNSLKQLKTPMPTWLTDVVKQLPVKKRSTLSYLNVEKGIKVLVSTVLDADTGAMIATGGLRNVTHFAAVSGQDEEEMISRSVIGMNGKRTGFLSLVGDRPLELKDLQHIPANSAMSVALRLNASQTLERFLGTMGQLEPRAVSEIEEMFQEIDSELNGFSIKKDLLPALGETWTAHATLDGGSFLSGWVFTAQVKDKAAVQRGMQQIMAVIARENERNQQRGRPQALRKLLVAGEQVYQLTIPDDDVLVAPAWCLREDEFVFTLFPQAMRSYLKRPKTTKSLVTLPQVKRLFQQQRSPAFVQYTDTRELFRWFYPMAQVGLSGLFTEMQRGGIDLDMSIVPTAGSIEQHLGPTVTAWYFQEDGIYVDVRQSVPGIGASNLMWVQGMMFFMLQRRVYQHEMEVPLPVEEADEAVPRR